MSTTEVRTAIDAVHMRVVYFGSPATPASSTAFSSGRQWNMAASEAHVDSRRPTSAAELARVFHQLDLLLDYAWLITRLPALGRGDLIVGEPNLFGITDSSETILRRSIAEVLARSAVDLGELTAESQVALKTLGISGGLHLRELTARQAAQQSRVVSLQMGSPLEVILELPLVAWPGLAIGLIALIDRIATAPARIARKRKQELLRSAILDKQTQLVVDGQADVLATLLLKEGPDRPVRGPSSVAFLDPEDPAGELEPVTVAQ